MTFATSEGPANNPVDHINRWQPNMKSIYTFRRGEEDPKNINYPPRGAAARSKYNPGMFNKIPNPKSDIIHHPHGALSKFRKWFWGLYVMPA